MAEEKAREGRIDFNFVKMETTEKDIELFLGPKKDTEQFRFFSPTDDRLKIAHFMYEAGIFPSVGAARKNGWNKPIPDGFSSFVVGKKKSLLTILNLNI